MLQTADGIEDSRLNRVSARPPDSPEFFRAPSRTRPVVRSLRMPSRRAADAISKPSRKVLAKAMSTTGARKRGRLIRRSRFSPVMA